MSMDKMREGFEAWAISQKSCVTKENEDYINPYVGYAWQAWQASRQALVVDVESLPSASYTDDWVVYRSHVESALDALGVNTK